MLFGFLFEGVAALTSPGVVGTVPDAACLPPMLLPMSARAGPLQMFPPDGFATVLAPTAITVRRPTSAIDMPKVFFIVYSILRAHGTSDKRFSV